MRGYIKTDFGKNLYKIMRQRNIQQKDLAEALDVSRPEISQIVNSQRQPLLSTAIRIAKILGVSLDELCGVQIVAKDKEKSQATEIAEELIGCTRDMFTELQRMNRQAKLLKKWAVRYKLMEDEDAVD